MHMKKALIICAAGFSSSLMAAKATEWIKENKKREEDDDIIIDAIGVTQGYAQIEKSDFILFLISPQTKMYFKKLQDVGDKVGKKVIAIPPQAYVPIPSGIEALAQLVLKEIPQ